MTDPLIKYLEAEKKKKVKMHTSTEGNGCIII